MDTSPSLVGANQAIATSSSVPNTRADVTRALVNQPAHAKFREAVSRGNCYGGMTATTGTTLVSLTVSATAPISLFNPKTSVVRLSVLRATMTFINGTGITGPGQLVYSINNNPGAAAVTGGTAITAVNLLVGGQANANGALATGATLPAIPTVVDNFASIYTTQATSTLPPGQVVDWLDGQFELLPGCSLTISGTTAAGTNTPSAVFGLCWEEIPNIA